MKPLRAINIFLGMILRGTIMFSCLVFILKWQCGKCLQFEDIDQYIQIYPESERVFEDSAVIGAGLRKKVTIIGQVTL